MKCGFCKTILVGIILWVPDSALENPCSLKRHLAAISLVLSWAEMITLVARHPRLAQYNIYVTMFYRVLRTFTLFLVSLKMTAGVCNLTLLHEFRFGTHSLWWLLHLDSTLCCTKI